MADKKLWKSILGHRSATVGLIIVLITLVTAIVGPRLAPYDYRDQNVMDRFQPPSREYLLGTDNLGRDVFSRILHGTSITVQIGFISVLIGLTLGLILGLMAGYFGGVIDRVISGLIEIMLAFPSLLLALVIVSILGPGLYKITLAVGIRTMPIFARLTRGQVLQAKNTEYVEAAHALGSGNLRVIISHIIPNIISPILVMATLQISITILTAAGLSFLGLGAQPPIPAWGSMVAEGRAYLRHAWWVSTFPGLAIMVIVMGFNLLGDGMRDIFDPQLQ
ncbi:MAG: ABC transporter permease [Bacillota bacterium]